MTVRVWRMFLFLGLVKLCVGLIRPASLEKRLCDADFVFKFKVTSNAVRYCVNPKALGTRKKLVLNPSTLPATPGTLSSVKTAPTLSRSSSASIGNENSQPTVRPTKSSSQSPREITTRNGVVHKETSSGRVDPQVPKKKPASSLGVATAPRVRHLRMSARLRRSFCFPVYYQDIRIIKKHVYKGLDGIKKMTGVNVTARKHYYESRVKRDLNFSLKLNVNEEYLFVGKRIPKGRMENHVFTANRYTIEPWTKAKKRLTKFNFDTKCKSN